MTDDEAKTRFLSMCVSESLYSSVALTKENTTTLRTVFISENHQFDSYCVACNNVSTFRTNRDEGHYNKWHNSYKSGVLGEGIFVASFACQRNNSHIYDYVFDWVGSSFYKIGQYPSLEDIASADIQRFRPVLEKQYFSELHRAGGLASHGIGIGAFVYLRRIFERLIVQHYDAFATLNGPIERFETLRMDEKIGALKAVLPAALVQNKGAYGILSAGIHELDEDTCKKYFPIVRAAIIAILEEDLQAREKERAAKELTDSLAAIAGELTTGKSNGDGPGVRPRKG